MTVLHSEGQYSPSCIPAVSTNHAIEHRGRLSDRNPSEPCNAICGGYFAADAVGTIQARSNGNVATFSYLPTIDEIQLRFKIPQIERDFATTKVVNPDS